MIIPMPHAANLQSRNLRRSLIDTDLLVAEELVARAELAPRGEINSRKLVITFAGAFEFQVGRSVTWIDSSRLLFANAGESYVDHHVVPGIGHASVILTPGEEAIAELWGNADAHFASRAGACSLRVQMLAQLLRRADEPLAMQELGIAILAEALPTRGGSQAMIHAASAKPRPFFKTASTGGPA